jgi:tRNA A-37 threonylcarbamoyl transferase component Bud32
LTIYDLEQKENKTEDTECSVKHDASRKRFVVHSKVIGKGAFGTVYETCEKDECTYVAKIVSKENFKQKEIYIQMAAARHDLAPMIYEIWDCRNNVMLIMNKINGITLNKFLRNNNDDDIKRRAVQKTFSAIQKLNDMGIIHNDLHSDNIMIREDESIIFIDFGHSDYFDHPITNPILLAVDVTTLRRDLKLEFADSGNWINEKLPVFQHSSNNVGKKRTVLLGIMGKKAASPAKSSKSVSKEKSPKAAVTKTQLPDWMHPNSKENAVPITDADNKKLEKAISIIEKTGYFDNNELIHQITTRLKALPDVLKRKVFEKLKE